MSTRSSVSPSVFWLSALSVAGIAFSLGFACAVPLAAFAAVAAARFGRRGALLVVGAVWLSNQCVGFLVLDYPRTVGTFAWGIALGVAGVLAAEAAGTVVRAVSRIFPRWGLVAAVPAFFAAFAAYEGALLAVSLAVGDGAGNFAPAIVLRVLAINAAAFGVLWAAHGIAPSTRNAAVPWRRRPAPASLR